MIYFSFSTNKYQICNLCILPAPNWDREIMIAFKQLKTLFVTINSYYHTMVLSPCRSITSPRLMMLMMLMLLLVFSNSVFVLIWLSFRPDSEEHNGNDVFHICTLALWPHKYPLTRLESDLSLGRMMSSYLLMKLFICYKEPWLLAQTTL